MNKTKILVVAGALAISSLVSAQSISIYAEPGQILDDLGGTVLFGGTVNSNLVNAFYGFVNSSTDLSVGIGSATAPTLSWATTTLGAISWSALVDGTAATGPGGWMTPGGAAFDSTTDVLTSVGTKPVIAFMNADGPESLVAGSLIILAEGDPFLTTFDNRLSSVGSGSFSAVAGIEGSLQMVAVVPEPSTFALFAGIFGLGFVVWRRRK